MNKIVILLLLSLSLSAFAQTNAKKELKKIETLEQAEEYIGETKSKKKKLMVFNEEKHQSKLAKELLDMPVGLTKTERTQFIADSLPVCRSAATLPLPRSCWLVAGC